MHPFRHKHIQLVNVKSSTGREIEGENAKHEYIIRINSKGFINQTRSTTKAFMRKLRKTNQCYLRPAQCCCICLANGLGRLGKCWGTILGFAAWFNKRTHQHRPVWMDMLNKITNCVSECVILIWILLKKSLNICSVLQGYWFPVKTIK